MADAGYHPLQAALAKRGGKAKPKPKPPAGGKPPAGDGLDWVRQGAAIRGGLTQPTQFGGKGALALALGRRR